MSEPAIRSIGYLVIIALGIVLRKTNVLKKEDGKTLSKISVKLTLPAALLSSFKGMTFQSSLVFVTVFGFVINIIMLGVGFLIYSRETKENRSIGMLNNSSYNIGSFSLPYVISMFDPSYIIYATMFDIGNSIYSMGLNYAIVDSYLNSKNSFNIKSFLGKLFSSLPFLMYLLLIFLLTFNLQLPNTMIEIASMIGSANILIVMLMFGVLFEFEVKLKEFLFAIKVLLIRYGTQGIVVMLMWIFVPFNVQVLQVFTLCLLSPMTSVIPSFIFNLGLNEKSSSIISSLSVVISIVINTILINIWI